MLTRRGLMGKQAPNGAAAGRNRRTRHLRRTPRIVDDRIARRRSGLFAALARHQGHVAFDTYKWSAPAHRRSQQPRKNFESKGAVAATRDTAQMNVNISTEV